MLHISGSAPRVVHQAEKTDHLRAQRRLVDGALAWEIEFSTFSGRTEGFHREAKDVVPIDRAGGAKSFHSPERGGRASGKWATGLQWAAMPAPRANDGYSRAMSLIELCASVPWFAWLPVGSGQSGEKHKGGGWKISLAVSVVFRGEEVDLWPAEIPHIIWTFCGWSVPSSEGTLLRQHCACFGSTYTKIGTIQKRWHANSWSIPWFFGGEAVT